MLNYFDLSNCKLCPRECHVNRLEGQLGFCHSDGQLHAARAALLYYEEPCISGSVGSGAIFFTGCNLGCVFCQNEEIKLGHDGNEGRLIDSEALGDAMLRLQEEQGAANINLVTASHVVPLVIPALEYAKAHGLRIPVVYNTSAYERAEVIRRLEGLVDIYLPDCKFYDRALAAQYARTPDYYDVAIRAISEMVRQCPQPTFTDGSHELNEDDDADDPLMVRGVIVRHMVMPGHTEDSVQVIRNLYERFGDQIFLSIMNQYTPMPQVAGLDPLLSQTVTDEEYEFVVDAAIEMGVTNGFLQEGETVSQSFIPRFDGTGL